MQNLIESLNDARFFRSAYRQNTKIIITKTSQKFTIEDPGGDVEAHGLMIETISRTGLRQVATHNLYQANQKIFHDLERGAKIEFRLSSQQRWGYELPVLQNRNLVDLLRLCYRESSTPVDCTRFAYQMLRGANVAELGTIYACVDPRTITGEGCEEQLAIGDVVGFLSDRDKLTHLAIYLGNDCYLSKLGLRTDVVIASASSLMKGYACSSMVILCDKNFDMHAYKKTHHQRIRLQTTIDYTTHKHDMSADDRSPSPRLA